MKEVRIHGRGGQGGVTSAELVAIAAINEGGYAQAFPSFGPERRGAPVAAFIRVSEAPIRTREKVYHPDIVLVLDGALPSLVNVTAGLKDDGIVVLNSHKAEAEVRKEFGIKGRLALVDANRIAMDVLGLPITNTTMLGALLKATGLVGMSALEEALEHRFGRLAEKNKAALHRAYEETVVC
ncbi:pyruvate synthase [Dissulfurirhabdus thermomarina]|uniref:Pyruvate synthase n=1 Tax=Dissulfurirhabdus thermomarina TaxID=1765737 RepID=A0A6N9TLE6_DISTH|nr:2-oxoacid:acceptor oxidoreductase family protein [Dissulfurirhabdus thermomarina]NDY42101.1 pyruvate synthase [Dissulfurirhabdus thermomarina]NMX22487.1 pyruvate synthase [Dissulfurirhabdus thermomarina]